jgi:hypothetical protein
MDVERIIDEIEQLQEMFEAADIGHSAQATFLLPIEGTTKCSHIVRGLTFGSGMACAAGRSRQCSDWARRRASPPRMDVKNGEKESC